MFNNVVYKALAFATKAHEGQTRKGSDTPYIVHPMTVALLAYSYSKDPDVACAALLHDTVEDTAVTMEEIRELFGEKVAVLVWSVTEENPDDVWKERKKQALKRVDTYYRNEMFLKTSDVIANCQDTLRDYRTTRFPATNLTSHYILMLKTLKKRALYLSMDFTFIRDIDATLQEMEDTFGVYSA